MEKYKELILKQQKGHEKEPRFMIGEQLLEMAAADPKCAELLSRDLEIEEMSLEAAENKLQEYADKNHGSARCFCITMDVAEGILREFYGLPPRTEKKAESEEGTSGFINLSDFL